MLEGLTNIMEWKKNVALSVGVIFAVSLTYEYKVRNSGPDCTSVSFEQATKTITDDFLMRMLYWDKEKETLGTDRPTLSFDHVGTQVTDVYFVPFTATGPIGSKMHFAMYTCKSGSIEYSSH